MYNATTTFIGADGSTGSASSVITVGDAQLTLLQGHVLPVAPGTSFDGVVATFRDPSPFAGPTPSTTARGSPVLAGAAEVLR